MFVVIAAALLALNPAQQRLIVAEANKVVGVPYDLGGRLQKNRGLDCQGLVFFALQPIARCGWRSWSLMPTESVKGELGVGVPGLSPTATTDLPQKLALLEPGDIIWFLDPTENPAEPALTTLAGVPQWVWHTGLYVGDGHVVDADPFAGAVVSDVLVDYVAAHYAGIYVTRIALRPAPHDRCRAHSPMRAPRR